LLHAATAAAVPQQKFAETLPPAAKCRDAAVVKQTLLLCCSFLSLRLPLQREAVAVSFLYLFSDYGSSMVTNYYFVAAIGVTEWSLYHMYTKIRM